MEEGLISLVFPVLCVFLKKCKAAFSVVLGHIQQIGIPPEVIIKSIIAEADAVCIGTVAPIVYFFDVSPEDAAQTHRAWFCCRVELAS